MNKSFLCLFIVVSILIGFSSAKLKPVAFLSKIQPGDKFIVCGNDGVYPNPDDCHTFYKCVAGRPYLYDCPEDLVYNPATIECDYRENVPSCGGGGSGSTAFTTNGPRPTATIPGGGVFYCPNNNNGVYPVPGVYCYNVYYSCVAGTPSVMTCPSGQIFNPATLTCVVPELASCRVDYSCPRPDGFFPIPGTCSGLHYVCIDNGAYYQRCPGNTIFDPLTYTCVADGTASCQAQPTTTTPRPTATIPGGGVFYCPNNNNGVYAVPGDYCYNVYYNCIAGTPYVVSCPSGQVFNPSTLTCVAPELASCRVDYNCPRPDGFFPIPGTCSGLHYVCIGNSAYYQRCPGTTIFDPLTNTCVADGAASCQPQSTTTTTSRPTATLPGGEQFICPSDNGFFPIPGTCNSDYYSCVSGSPYVLTCPISTIFDPISRICVVPELASCRVNYICPQPDGFFPIPDTCSGLHYICIQSDAYYQKCPGTSIFDPLTYACVADGSASCQNGITVSTSATSRPTSGTGFNCPANGQYPYPGSCTLYYLCSNGNAVVAQCPSGQVFNPTQQYCERPGNVPGCSSVSEEEYEQDSKMVGSRI